MLAHRCEDVGLAAQRKQSCWEDNLKHAGEIHPHRYEGKLLVSPACLGRGNGVKQEDYSKGADSECSAYSIIHFSRSQKLHRIADGLKSEII